MKKSIDNIFNQKIIIDKNLVRLKNINSTKDNEKGPENQRQTNNAFSEKWSNASENELTNDETFIKFSKDWFLKLYGFSSEKELKSLLNGKTILDAGCGIGFKTSWISNLASDSLMVGMDLSDSVYTAAKNYNQYKNLFFIQGNIANTEFKDNSFDLIICDQVLMHTENPQTTLSHLSKKLKPGGIFLFYFYTRKALPRELIDDFFRYKTHNLDNKELWELSSQLTELGKNLSEIDTMIKSPDIPLLGIKGGEYTIQRFVYWNLLKCFYNPDFKTTTNDIINFDWYSPSNAKRYSKTDILDIIESSNFEIEFLNQEEACYSGRLKKQ